MKSRKDLIRHFKERGYRTGAEIGVAKGAFSHRLLLGIPDLKLYSIDIWVGKYAKYEAEARQVLGKYPNCEIIKEPSLEAVKRFADKSLDFVYIDGDHSTEGVRSDIEAWLPKVKAGGCVAGHDYQLDNIKAVVDPYGVEHTIGRWEKYHSWWFFI